MKCTQKNPAMRYHDCASLLLDLKRSLVDPDGDFVVIGNKGNVDDRTVVMSTEEINEVQRRRYPNDDDDYDEDGDYDSDGEDDDDDNDDNDRDRGRRRKNNVNSDTKRIMKILMIVAGVVVALLILFLVGNAAGFFTGPGLVQNEQEMVKVPDLRGMTEEEARKKLDGTDIGMKVENERKPSNKYKEGEIMSQDPPADTEVAKNSTITVVISSGEEAKMVRVPNVVDRTEEEAEKSLQAAKLTVVHGEAQYSDEIEEGHVISSDPAADTEVEEGTEVTIVISLGTEQVSVPDLRNKSAADAEAALAAVGLTGSASEEYSDSVAAGQVISQSISYVVSKGPKTQLVTIPSDIVGATQDAAKKRLQEEGLTGVYVEEEYSDYPAGTVSRVDPSPGAKIEKGSQVRYWISIGPAGAVRAGAVRTFGD